MNFEKYIEIFNKIFEVDNEFLKSEFITHAIEYARVRTDWYLMDSESRRTLDNSRTLKHNAFIDSIISISRFMGNHNQDNLWFTKLPDYKNTSGRKEWGDFACCSHYYLGILLK